MSIRDLVAAVRFKVGLYRRRAPKRARLSWDSVIGGLVGPLPRPEKWVFVVGCNNSGTTLLHKLLAAHPSIGSMPKEGQFYTNELPREASVARKRLWAVASDRFRLDETSDRHINVNRLKRQWGARYNDPKRPILLEKSPTNTMRTRWLQEHFENAHFIGIIRDGRAVAEGIRRKAGHPLALAALQWVRSNEMMLQDFAVLRHGKLVRYEELTRSPEEVVGGLLQFLGLNPNGFQVGDRTWYVNKQVSKIRNMNPRSLSALSSEDRAEIQRVAGDLMTRLDYDI